MHSPLRMRERRAGLFDEDTPGIREFHNPSLVASEQVKSMLCFEVGDLFAESRLGYVQSVRGPCEIQLFGEGYDCVQVTYFDVGEHCSNPCSRVLRHQEFRPVMCECNDEWLRVWNPA